MIQKFENFAGRSAMLGFVALVVAEIADSPVVHCDDPAIVITSAILAMSTGERLESTWVRTILVVHAMPDPCFPSVCTATILALTRQRLGGGLLLEAVVASLTSAQRSASSLTAAPGSVSSAFDAAVDRVVEQAFDNERCQSMVVGFEEGVQTRTRPSSLSNA